jgi:hypothetical protein
VTDSRDWTQLQAEVAVWARETFGESTIAAKFHHFIKELVEIAEHPGDVTEWADAFLILMDAATLAGFTMDEVLEACKAKHAINLTRTWGEPDENGVVEHVRDEPPIDAE